MTYLLSGASVFFCGGFSDRDINVASLADRSESVVTVDASK